MTELASVVPTLVLLMACALPLRGDDKVIFLTPEEQAARQEKLRTLQAENHELRQRVAALERDLEAARAHNEQIRTLLESSQATAELFDREALRLWTSADGGRVLARLGEVRSNRVELISADGQKRKVPLDRLSTPDQDFVRQVEAFRSAPPTPQPEPDPLAPSTLGAVEIIRVPAEP